MCLQGSDEEMDTSQEGEGDQQFVAHVPVPSQEEVCSAYPAHLETTARQVSANQRAIYCFNELPKVNHGHVSAC